MTRSARDSVRAVGNGRYRVAITVGYDPDTGKQVRVDRTFRCTKRDLPMRIEELRRQYGTVSAAVYGDMPVAEYVRDVWLSDGHRKKLSPTTLAGYDATIRNHIEPGFARLKMRDANAIAIGMALDGITRAGAALNAYKMLRSAFRQAAGAGIITGNPMVMVPRPSPKPYRADVYTFDEVVQVIDVFRDSDIEPGVIIAALCGTRASETCAVDWHDDLLLRRTKGEAGGWEFSGEVRIREGYHRVDGERMLRQTKTEESNRLIAIPGFAVERLMELRGDFGGVKRIGPVMVDSTGQRMAPGDFGSRWRKKLKPRYAKNGRLIYEPPMRYVELKNLRHSHTTYLLDEMDVSMRKVSKRDGHAKESTTADFYDRHKMAADHDVADAIDKKFREREAGRETRANSR